MSEVTLYAFSQRPANLCNSSWNTGENTEAWGAILFSLKDFVGINSKMRVSRGVDLIEHDGYTQLMVTHPSASQYLRVRYSLQPPATRTIPRGRFLFICLSIHLFAGKGARDPVRSLGRHLQKNLAHKNHPPP